MKDERLLEILKVINENQSVSIETLMKTFYLSDSTIRRQLKKLEDKGLILRSYGKAISITSNHQPLEFSKRRNFATKEKELIASKAISCCMKDNCVVMLDASSTAMRTISYLQKYSNVTVITSGIETLFLLSQTDLTYFSSGGQALAKSYSFIGQTAIDTIKTFNADVCFVSCHGLSDTGYATDDSIFENDVRKTILNQSKRKVLLIDSTKINKTCHSNLCHISEFDDVFCDKPLPEHIAKHIKNLHVIIGD